MTNEQPQPAYAERPMIGLGLMPKGNETTPRGTPKMCITLLVSTGMIQFQAYLCDVEDAKEAADLWAEKIMQAGTDGKRQQSGLVVANGAMPDAKGLQKQGQVQRRTRGKST